MLYIYFLIFCLLLIIQGNKDKIILGKYIKDLPKSF